VLQLVKASVLQMPTPSWTMFAESPTFFRRGLVYFAEMHNIVRVITNLRDRCGIVMRRCRELAGSDFANARVECSPAVLHLSWRVDPAARARSDRCRRWSPREAVCQSRHVTWPIHELQDVPSVRVA
jgi:hypothetical protein